MQPQKPIGFEKYLSEFGPVSYDPFCGEPVAWGFKITRHLGDDLFNDLGKHGQLVCIDGFNSSWALVTKTLNRNEAIALYGEVTNEVFGPRGGWKSITFGNKVFVSKYLKTEKK
ncbi:hypothetical protein SAMN05421788_1011133 [Filimonas lacunae]|uniref:Uncharacterized protein n=1 Tax=Filimonas lacunae TaxID=477680 RepID=A0A1N7LU95_9BACT|nr:hypothetical protein [Filimonas lacunae]SIS77425.1 hypothetical protein SAMN05421788_1011133 [Filimonas lacunae]